MKTHFLFKRIFSVILFITICIICCSDSGSDNKNSFTDPRDGKTYKTVTIGDQVWMAENLDYDAGEGCWDALKEEYGKLYCWETAINVAPEGWHLPSDSEWQQLEIFLGMSESDAEKEGERGTDEGDKLKSDRGWYINDIDYNGTNSSGFSALPACLHDSLGYLAIYVPGAYFWTSSNIEIDQDQRAWVHYLLQDTKTIYRETAEIEFGYSVRLVKD